MDDVEIKLENFLAKISTWMTHCDIIWNAEDRFPRMSDVECALNADYRDFRQSSQQQLQETLFLLNQYLYRLNMELAKEQSVKAWADQGINFLIAGQEFPQYTKWEEKKFLIVRKSKIAEKLQELKTVSDARILIAEAIIKKVETSMKIIENMGRIKMYERS